MAVQWHWVTRWVPAVPSLWPGSYMCCGRGVDAMDVLPSAMEVAAPVQWSLRPYPRMRICREMVAPACSGVCGAGHAVDRSCLLQCSLLVWDEHGDSGSLMMAEPQQVLGGVSLTVEGAAGLCSSWASYGAAVTDRAYIM